ncbi:MAG: hypothetical protein HZA11_07430 [Nitrospirae bacterium]|nr:hypothetical protein [Nitrospirota bacterium]
MKKYIVVISFLVIALLGVTAGYSYADQYIGPYTITKIEGGAASQAGFGKVVYLYTSGGFSNPSGCSSGADNVMFLGDAADQAQEIALAAMQMNRQVSIYSCGCYFAYQKGCTLRVE